VRRPALERGARDGGARHWRGGARRSERGVRDGGARRWKGAKIVELEEYSA